MLSLFPPAMLQWSISAEFGYVSCPVTTWAKLRNKGGAKNSADHQTDQHSHMSWLMSLAEIASWMANKCSVVG